MQSNTKLKQLDIVVSPPAFVWGPNLTLTHVIVDDFITVFFFQAHSNDRQTDGWTDGQTESDA